MKMKRGRPRKQVDVNRILELRQMGYSIRQIEEIMRINGKPISKSSVHRILKHCSK